MKLAAPNALPVVSVCRPSRFGNPFRVEEVRDQVRAQLALIGVKDTDRIQQAAQQLVVDRFEQLMENPAGLPGDAFLVSDEVRQRFYWMRKHLDLIRDKNLACYCSLQNSFGAPNPCHVDILLAVANRP